MRNRIKTALYIASFCAVIAMAMQPLPQEQEMHVVVEPNSSAHVQYGPPPSGTINLGEINFRVDQVTGAMGATFDGYQVEVVDPATGQTKLLELELISVTRKQ